MQDIFFLNVQLCLEFHLSQQTYMFRVQYIQNLFFVVNYA